MPDAEGRVRPSVLVIVGSGTGEDSSALELESESPVSSPESRESDSGSWVA